MRPLIIGDEGPHFQVLHFQSTDVVAYFWWKSEVELIVTIAVLEKYP